MSASRLELPRLIIPGENGQALAIDLRGAKPSEFLRSRLILADDQSSLADWYRGLDLSGKSNYASNKLLNHAAGKTSWTMPTKLYAALCTTAPTAASTGTTIVEANFTGYERLAIEPAQFAESTAQKLVTNAKKEFAACTAGSSTVVGFALVDALTVGNVIYWGTTTSTVISTTQTPATLASGAVEVTES